MYGSYKKEGKITKIVNNTVNTTGANTQSVWVERLVDSGRVMKWSMVFGWDSNCLLSWILREVIMAPLMESGE